MIHEGVVLLGVEDFQQGSRGIAAVVAGHLVHLVKAEQGIIVLTRFRDWMILPGRAPM